MMNTTIMTKSIKSYSELVLLPTFEERYKYLRLNGSVGKDTFGFDRYINQRFYRSREWKRVRDTVIIRDNGCDLGIEGNDIFGKIIIHHMNPILPEDFQDEIGMILDPEYLICVSHRTHNAIHYSDEKLLDTAPPERRKHDTCPWRH